MGEWAVGRRSGRLRGIITFSSRFQFSADYYIVSRHSKYVQLLDLAGVILVACVCLLASCSQTPTPPTVTDQVTISMTKSDTAGGPLKFTATVNFVSEAELFYEWYFDTTRVVTKGNFVTRSLGLLKPGSHALQVHVHRTGDGLELCSTTSTFVVFDSITIDTTKRISPDSLSANLLTRYIFKAHLPSIRTLKSYELVWTIDGARFIRFNTDTISSVFQTVGAHSISVAREDTSTGVPVESASTVVLVSFFKLSISSSSTSPTVLSPVTFTAIPNGSLLLKTHLTWDFGDGTTVTDSNSSSAIHSFRFVGKTLVRLSLFQGSVLIGIDSIVETILPSIVGFSVSALPGFRRGTSLFSGIPSTGRTQSNSCLGFYFKGDNLTWNVTNFAYGTSHSNSSSGEDTILHTSHSESSYDNSHFQGRFSLDGMTLDSLDAYMDQGNSSHYQNYTSGTSSVTGFDSHSSLSCLALQLQWFTQDSIQYAMIGPDTKNNVTVGSACQSYGSGLGGFNWSYPGTDWNSNNPILYVVVTFYKH